MKNEESSQKKEVTDKQVLSFYGMATRAGKTVSGMDQVSVAVRAENVYILLVATDASDRTREKSIQLSRLHKIPCFLFSNVVELGTFSGKNSRAICGVIDEGFAKKLLSLLKINQSALQM